MKSISPFVIAFLVFGFLFLALPHKGYSQNPGCCIDEGGDCLNIGDVLPSACNFGSINPDGVCTIEGPGGECVNELPPPPLPEPPLSTTAVPTLSEWGLIAMAGVLAIIGLGAFLVRRKKLQHK